MVRVYILLWLCHLQAPLLLGLLLTEVVRLVGINDDLDVPPLHLHRWLQRLRLRQLGAVPLPFVIPLLLFSFEHSQLFLDFLQVLRFRIDGVRRYIHLRSLGWARGLRTSSCG